MEIVRIIFIQRKNELLKTIDALGNETEYEYDANSNLVKNCTKGKQMVIATK